MEEFSAVLSSHVPGDQSHRRGEVAASVAAGCAGCAAALSLCTIIAGPGSSKRVAAAAAGGGELVFIKILSTMKKYLYSPLIRISVCTPAGIKPNCE